jgi:hypothetical protein
MLLSAGIADPILGVRQSIAGFVLHLSIERRRPLRDDPVLLALAQYWAERRNGREFPDREDIDPLAMPRSILPHLSLAEISDGGRRARYRLVGTEIVSRLGQDFTGREVADVMSGDYHLFITSMFRAVHEYRAPLYSESQFRCELALSRTRRLLLPLSRNRSGRVDQILMGQTWPPSDYTEMQPLICVLDAGGTFEETLREVVSIQP